jgi:hypothetical protein
MLAVQLAECTCKVKKMNATAATLYNPLFQNVELLPQFKIWLPTPYYWEILTLRSTTVVPLKHEFLYWANSK